MKEIREAIKEILEHLQEASTELDKEQVEKFIQILLEAKRVFVVGAGRSGLVVRAFAMRLMHLGMDVYVVGETITPGLQENDVMVAVSGSGETDMTVGAAKIAKRVGCKMVAVTSYPRSTLAKLADTTLILPGRRKTESMSDFVKRELAGEHASLAPLGTLFEIAALVFLDSAISSIMRKLNKREEDLKARHANI